MGYGLCEWEWHWLNIVGELARETLAASQAKMKERYDSRAELREFIPGDKVLALGPLIRSPFQFVNLLRLYYEQSPGVSYPIRQEGGLVVSPVLVFGEMKAISSECTNAVLVLDEELLSGCLKNSETLKNLRCLLVHLSETQAREFEEPILHPALLHRVCGA